MVFVTAEQRSKNNPCCNPIFTIHDSRCYGVTVWAVIFSGDRTGYLNSLLLRLNLIQSPITWLQNEETLMPIMIIVALWSSMGIGFLSILSGIMNVNKELYEAARLDGVKNRVQEALYVTIPSIRPQLLFGAVMAVVNAFNSAGLGVQLSGSNPTPGYAGSVIVNHIDDFGFIRYEMGYAAAISVFLFLMMAFARVGIGKLLDATGK